MGILNVFKKEKTEEAVAEPETPQENMIKCSQCGKEVREKKAKTLGKDRNKVCKKCFQLAKMASGANYR